MPEPRIASVTRRVSPTTLRGVGPALAAEVWYAELGRALAELQRGLTEEGWEHAGPAEYTIWVSVPIRKREVVPGA